MQQVRNRCKGDGPAKWKSNLRDPVISSGQLSGWECVGHDRLRSGVRPGRCGAHPFAIRRTHLPMLFPSRAGAPRNLAKSHRGLVIHEVDPLITRTRLSPSWASEPEPHRAASRQGVELHLGPRLFYMDEGQRHPAVGDFKTQSYAPGRTGIVSVIDPANNLPLPRFSPLLAWQRLRRPSPCSRRI